MQLNKNKIVNLSAGFLLLFLVLINLIIYSYPNIVSKYFTIKTVIINGSVNSDENQIRKSVIKYKANLIEPNSLKIKDSVESNAWVKRASVKKIFPSTLLIEIIENDPFAIYKRKKFINVFRDNYKRSQYRFSKFNKKFR